MDRVKSIAPIRKRFSGITGNIHFLITKTVVIEERPKRRAVLKIHISTLLVEGTYPHNLNLHEKRERTHGSQQHAHCVMD